MAKAKSTKKTAKGAENGKAGLGSGERRSPRKSVGKTKANARKKEVQESDEESSGEDEDVVNSDDENFEQDEVDEAAEEDGEYNSDALDDEDDTARTKAKAKASLKRKRASGTTSAYFDETSPSKKQKPTKKGKSSASPKKGRKKRKTEEAEDTGDEEFELDEGQEVVGRVVEAPKTGRVPPGQISHNTFNFLEKLKDPKCNDRQWFKLHEPVYRLAEQEWKDFISAFTDLLVEVDTQIPPLPPKDVIHRIYRDIRFSNDKTPYKKGFSASFSRSGRKGVFAGYHVAIKPGGESMIAAGTWCPGRNELSTIRSNILRSPTRLRQILAAPAFVKHFGKPSPPEDGGRRNIFGMEDELKNAPKIEGVDKSHKDIDLLRCRSFAVSRRFTDEEVLSPGFKQQLAGVVGVVRDFVHCLNDMMTIGGGAANGNGNARGGGGSGGAGSSGNGSGRQAGGGRSASQRGEDEEQDEDEEAGGVEEDEEEDQGEDE